MSAYDAIIKYQPDLLFLDIEMPNGNAFDLLEKFREIDFDIIFTTAYDHYAIKAIKFSALDYILKPVEFDELLIKIRRLFDTKRFWISSVVNSAKIGASALSTAAFAS